MGKLWRETLAQDIAEYAIMLAMILVVVIATLKLVGQNTLKSLDKAEDALQSSDH